MKKQDQKEQSLDEALFAFRRKLSDLMRREAEDLKCPISHIDTLVYIAEKGTPSMKEISDHLNITPPSRRCWGIGAGVSEPQTKTDTPAPPCCVVLA